MLPTIEFRNFGHISPFHSKTSTTVDATGTTTGFCKTKVTPARLALFLPKKIYWGLLLVADQHE